MAWISSRVSHSKKAAGLTRGLRRCALGFAFTGAVGLALAADVENDEVVPERREMRQKLASVKEWQGVWEVRDGGGVTMITPGGREIDSHYEEKTRGSFLLKRFQRDWDPRRGILVWQGDGEAIGRGRGTYSEWLDGGGVRLGKEYEQSYTGTMPQSRIKFELGFGKKSRFVSLHPGHWTDKDVPRNVRVGREVVLADSWERAGREVKIDENHAKPVTVWFLGAGEDAVDRRWAVVSGGSSVLEFTWEGEGGGGGQHYGEDPTGIVIKRSRVLLIPVHDNLEVELEIAGYDQWRPKGKISDPKQPGNNLKVRATLKNKDGTPPEELPPVQRFIFELIDTSREPGICLNWPLNAKDNDPDLRLADAGMNGELSKEDQKLIIKTILTDEQDQPYADAQVDSYDFGGQSELRVICELEDGREVVGLLKDDKGGKDLVRLPKMDGPGWIAESWRKEHGVSDLPDNNDDEKVEGQDYKGDGFTLYEEYRGFVENGVHISGDPKKKDLFILNRADVVTRDGIALLERIAKLKVHGRLRDGKEMDGESRVMNGNHRAAPHRVKQHGVVLSHVGMGQGGYTAGTPEADSRKASRPGTVSQAYIEPPGSIAGLFSPQVLKRYHLDHLDSRQLYAAAVAHELAHAIGAEHHGEKRMEVRWGHFESIHNPNNRTGKARFVEEGNPTKELVIQWEDTLQSVALDQEVVFNAHAAAHPGSLDRDFFVESMEYWCNRIFFVGPAKNGTDAGDEHCVMRYYFSTAYEATGNAHKVYAIRPGAKRGETILCTAAKGTGGNAASHQPQSRFGDAAGGRGNCFSVICPNDAIPPKSNVIK